MNDLEQEDARVRAEMQRIAHWVHAQLPKGWHYVILAMPSGRDGRINYIANARRTDVVRLMHEFIEATHDSFGEHKPDVGKDELDSELGRLRQRCAALELELERYRTIVEPGSGKASL